MGQSKDIAKGSSDHRRRVRKRASYISASISCHNWFRYNRSVALERTNVPMKGTVMGAHSLIGPNDTQYVFAVFTGPLVQNRWMSAKNMKLVNVPADGAPKDDTCDSNEVYWELP